VNGTPVERHPQEGSDFLAEDICSRPAKTAPALQDEAVPARVNKKGFNGAEGKWVETVRPMVWRKFSAQMGKR